MESENPAGWIVFDTVEIDLAGRRLFVAGKVMPLEPKAFDVLALLARHPGRAVGRNEILDAVWGHRHVTPGVLNRVVTLLRQALGERVEDQHYVHTLHGIGYRFDAEARLLHARPVLSGANAGTNTSESIVPAPLLAPVLNEAALLPVATPATDEKPAESLIPPTSPASLSSIALTSPATRRTRLRTAVVACMLLAMVAGLLGLHHALTPMPAPSPVLVVLPLRVVGADSNETAFADGLSEDLTNRLADVDACA